jgi:TonB-dependent receptor-like protein
MDVDTTAKDGAFRLPLAEGFDSLQLSLQVTDKHLVRTATDSVKVESFQYPHLSTPLPLRKQFFASGVNSISLLQNGNVDTVIFPGKGLLPLVTVKAIKQKELSYDESRRINSISQIVTSDKFRYGGRDAIGNAILTVPGVTLISGDISIFGLDISSKSQIRRPLIIMDGIEIPSNVAGSVLEFLNSLSPADIEFIEVLRGAEASIYGHRGAYGVISINSRRGPDKSNNAGSTLLVFTPVVYHVCPNFEMPDYSNAEIKNAKYPDQRTSIYWNANIPTDSKGEADISFYTGDSFTTYAITVTGLTESGELIFKRVMIDNSGKNR